MRNEIQDRFKRLMKELLEIDLDQYGQEAQDIPFLSETFKVSPFQLFSLFMETEKVFHVRFPDEIIANGGFSSFNAVISLIETELSSSGIKHPSMKEVAAWQ